jgi:hypothetical protein
MPYHTDICVIRFAGREYQAHYDLCRAAGFSERTQWFGSEIVYADPTYESKEAAHAAILQALSENLEGEAAVIRAGVMYRLIKRDQMQYNTARIKFQSTQNFRENMRRRNTA